VITLDLLSLVEIWRKDAYSHREAAADIDENENEHHLHIVEAQCLERCAHQFVKLMQRLESHDRG